MILDVLPDRIREARQRCGYTQVTLSKALSVSRSLVSAWEQGTNTPTIKQLIRMTELFHVSADYLIGIEKERSISTAGLRDETHNALAEIVRCMKLEASQQPEE